MIGQHQVLSEGPAPPYNTCLWEKATYLAAAVTRILALTGQEVECPSLTTEMLAYS